MLKSVGNLRIRGVQIFSRGVVVVLVILLVSTVVVRHRIYATVAEESATLGKEVLKQNRSLGNVINPKIESSL
jgi:hypothetical protein